MVGENVITIEIEKMTHNAIRTLLIEKNSQRNAG